MPKSIRACGVWVWVAPSETAEACVGLGRPPDHNHHVLDTHTKEFYYRSALSRTRSAHSAMLAALAAPILEKHLGKWLKLESNGVDSNGGKIRLRRVEIRESAWDDLALPIALRGGMIEEVEVDIPWTKLKTESVMVRLHRPMLLLAPHAEGEWDYALEQRRAQVRKENELQRLRDAAAPVAKNAATAAVDDEKSGWIDRLIQRAIDNMQILVTGAVIRYEDYSHADQPFGFEVAFDSLWIHPEHVHAPEPGSAASTAARATSSDERPPLAHREALVCALCAYMLDATALPSQPQLEPCGSAEALEARMASHGIALDAPAALRANARRCCLTPLSFAAEVVSRRVDQPSLPQHVICLETGRLQIELNATELTQLASCLAYLQHFEELEAYRSFRPSRLQRPSTHPKEWWKYVCSAVRWQLRSSREPYTWAAVMRRGKQRRHFVHLHKKMMSNNSGKAKDKDKDNLSEPERVSLAQLRDALSAADQLLFERLAMAEMQGEQAATASAAAASKPPARLMSFKRRRSTFSVDMLAAERSVKFSKEQRNALAELLENDDDRPSLNERLSLHARLLLSEVVLVLHTEGHHGTKGDDGSEHVSRMPTLQASIQNVGVHVGIQPTLTLSDLYWQSIRLESFVQGSAAPIPLITPMPDTHLNRRRSNIAQHIPIEVDTTGAFNAVGLADRLPKLCERSDSAHATSVWQLGIRWQTEDRSLVGERLPHSEVAIRWRSSQRLAILCNHSAVTAAIGLATSVSSCFSELDPAANLMSATNTHAQQSYHDPSQKSRSRPAVSASEDTLRRTLLPVERLTIRLSVDLAAPAWIFLLHPDHPDSQALLFSARRVLADGLLEPTAIDADRFERSSSLPSRINVDVEPLTPLSRHTPLGRTPSKISFAAGKSPSLRRLDTIPLKERAKRASWGAVKALGRSMSGRNLLSKSPSFGLGSPSSPPHLARSSSLDPPPLPPPAQGPPGARLRAEAEHLEVKLIRLEQWLPPNAAKGSHGQNDPAKAPMPTPSPPPPPPPNTSSVASIDLSPPLPSPKTSLTPPPPPTPATPAPSTPPPPMAAPSLSPLEPFEIAINIRAPCLSSGAVLTEVTLTPIVCNLKPIDIPTLHSVMSAFMPLQAQGQASPPQSESSVPTTLSSSTQTERASEAFATAHIDSNTPLAPTLQMIMSRSRFSMDLAAISLSLCDSVLPGALPLVEFKLSCVGLHATGGERLRQEQEMKEQRNAEPMDEVAWARAREAMLREDSEEGSQHERTEVQHAKTTSITLPHGGVKLSCTVAALQFGVGAMDSPLLALVPAPLNDAEDARDDVAVVQPGPEAISVQLDMLPDPITKSPCVAPHHPPAIQLGLLEADIRPRRCKLVLDHLQRAAEQLVLSQGLATAGEANALSPLERLREALTPPKASPRSGKAREANAMSGSMASTVEPDALTRALKATRILVHAATVSVIDEEFGRSRTGRQPEDGERDSYARLELRLWQAGFAMPQDQITAALGRMALCVGLRDAPMDTIVSTHSSVEVTVRTGQLWEYDIKMPRLSLLEPLTPAKPMNQLLLAMVELPDVLNKPTSTSESGANNRIVAVAEATDDTRVASQPDTPKADADDAQEIEVRAILESSALLDAHNTTSSSSSGLEAHIGAMHLRVSARFSSALQQDLGITNADDDDSISEGMNASSFDSAMSSLDALAASLPPAAQHVADQHEIMVLPAAAIYVILKNEPDKPAVPHNVEIAFGETPASVHILAHHIQRLQTFAGRLAHLNWDDSSGEIPARFAMRLPSADVQLVYMASGEVRTSPPPPLSAHLSGLSVVLTASPPDQFGAEQAYEMMARLNTIRVGLPQEIGAPLPGLANSVARTPLLAACTSSRVLDVLFKHSVDVMVPSALDVTVHPLRVVLAPESNAALSMHADAWKKDLTSHAIAPALKSSAESPSRVSEAMATTLNLTVQVKPSDVWVLLTLASDEAGSYGEAERLGLLVRLGASTSITAHQKHANVDPTPPETSAECTTCQFTLEHLGSTVACFTLASEPDVHIDPLVDPMTWYLHAEVLETVTDAMAVEPQHMAHKVDATLSAPLPITMRVSAPQVKVLSELVKSIAGPLAKSTVRDGSTAVAVGSSKSMSPSLSRPTSSTAPYISSGGGNEASQLVAWLRSCRMDDLTLKVSVPGGMSGTFHGAAGLSGQPIIRVAVPSVEGYMHIQTGSHYDSTTARLSMAGEVLVWSKAAQAWEALLPHTACSLDAQRQSRGIWSGALELQAIDISLSDAMIQRVQEANTAVATSLKEPTTIEAIRPRVQQPMIYLVNQTGCTLRARLHGIMEPFLIPTGESRTVHLDVKEMSSAVISELSMDASGIWHELPPIAPGRFGSWHTLARAAPAQPVASSTGTQGTRLPLSLSLSEPVAVQYVVRPTADDSGTAGSTGLAVRIRSIGAIRNSTERPICVQLLLPHGVNVKETSEAAFGDVSDSYAQDRPQLSHATPSAVDIGVDHLLEVGSIPPGGTLPIPPHLSSVAYVRVRPADHEGYQWPEAKDSFWLGSCNQTRRQARQLARLLSVFNLPKTEQLHTSWTCSLSGLPEGSRVRGRLYLTSSALIFEGKRDITRLLRLEHLVALEKTNADRVVGVRSSAAITARAVESTGSTRQTVDDEKEMQLCGFVRRNRVYTTLQQHLATRLPRLAATWRTPSSGKLQTHLGLPDDLFCLGELSVSVDGVKGVLLLTPSIIGFVAEGDEPTTWTTDVTDVLRVRVGGDTATAKPRRRGKQQAQMRFVGRLFESTMELRSPLADALDLLEGLLPEGAIEVEGADEKKGDVAEAGDDDVADLIDAASLDGASGSTIVHQLEATQPDGSSTFRACISVQTKPCILHGHAHSGSAASLTETMVTIHAPLQLESALPYPIDVVLTKADAAAGEVERQAACATIAPGVSTPITLLPGGSAALKLRLRMAGPAWSNPLAEHTRALGAQEGWKGGVQPSCVLRDPHGRAAHVTIRNMPSSSRAVLSVLLEAPLWVLNYSSLPLVYSASTARFGAARAARQREKLARRRSSMIDQGEGGDGGRKGVKAKASAVSSALSSKLGVFAQSAKAKATQLKTVAEAGKDSLKERKGGAMSVLRGKFAFGKKKAADDGASAEEGGPAAAEGDSSYPSMDAGLEDEMDASSLVTEEAMETLDAAQSHSSEVDAVADGVDEAEVAGEEDDQKSGEEQGDGEEEEDDEEDALDVADAAQGGPGEGADDVNSSGESDGDDELFADELPNELSSASTTALGPLLMSGRRIKVALGSGSRAEGRWSKPVVCEVVGDSLGVPVGTYELGLIVLEPPPSSPRSRVILIHPRYRILNRSGINLQYRSISGQIGGVLAKAEASLSTPFHWGETLTSERFLQLRAMDVESEAALEMAGDGAWCGAFAIDVPTEVVLALPDETADSKVGQRLLQVTVEAVGPSLVVTIDATDVAPYQICNDFPHNRLVVRQQGCTREHVVRANTKIDFTWDEPTGVKVLVVNLVQDLADWDEGPESPGVLQRPLSASMGSESEFALTDEGDVVGNPEFELRPEELVVEPKAHRATPAGPVIMWTTVELGQSTRIVRVAPVSSNDQARELELQASFSFSVQSVSLSLVDTARRHELLHLRADALALSAIRSALEEEVHITVERVQVDNQLPNALHPRLLSGVPLSSSDGHWLQCQFSRRTTEKRLRKIDVDAKQLSISLDEPFLVSMYYFLQRCVHSSASAGSSASAAASGGLGGALADDVLTAGSPLAIVRQASAELRAAPARRKRPWYIDKLCLQNLKLQLRYRKLPEPSARGSGSGSSRGWRPPALPNVNNLALELRAFEFDQRFADRRWLIKRLRKHYMAEVRRQVHKILLHTDVASMVAEHSAFARAGRGVFTTLTGWRGGGGGGGGGGASGASAAGTALGGKGSISSETAREDGSVGFVAAVCAASGRRRLPRALIGPGREVCEYDEIEAVGWHFLHCCPELREQARGEPLLCCVRAAASDNAFVEQSIFILTDMRLACVALAHPLKLLWQMTLRDVSALDTSPDDPLALHLGMHDGEASARRPVEDRSRTIRLANDAATDKIANALLGFLDLDD